MPETNPREPQPCSEFECRDDRGALLSDARQMTQRVGRRGPVTRRGDWDAVAPRAVQLPPAPTTWTRRVTKVPQWNARVAPSIEVPAEADNRHSALGALPSLSRVNPWQIGAPAGATK